MKKNDLLEIKNMNIAGLAKKAGGLVKEVANLSLEKNMHKLKNFKSVTQVRKSLAQVLTILNQKNALEALKGAVQK